MKHILSILLFLVTTCNFMAAQDFQGKAIYQSKTSSNVNLDNRQMSAEQKKRIMERMKNALEKTYELSFDRTASLYEEEEKLDQPSANANNGRRGFRFTGLENGIYYKNIRQKQYVNAVELLGKKFLVKDSLPQWEWKLGSETKKIGNYMCYKATATKAIDSTMENFFRRGRSRRGRPDNQEKKTDTIQKDTVNTSLLSRTSRPKERIVTVWYTPEIPICQGPGNYWGLPGLILEASDGRTAILCTKIILNSDEKVAINAPNKGKEVTQAEYDELREEKMKEMSERFRGGNRGGGNRGGFRN